MSTAAAVLILLVFLVVEARLRQGADARSLKTTAADRGSTGLIGGAFAVAALAFVLAQALNARGVARMPEVLGWIGVALMLVAFGGRVWAARVLGAAYTRTLRTFEGQRVVRTGPYRLIRHPGYASSILLWAGGGLATTNWLSLAIIVVVMVGAYAWRIAAEERMLIDAFGDEYRHYTRHTWRLLPLIY